ncbi:MAG: hypothetical protein CM1200mP10_22450 [Candidatus Neomarinimicrobiota bacterium]|nr:MAG: hypothetical protein CM1200mP10_22450 [Candidatus Neomarinimicrobiota bacterium]
MLPYRKFIGYWQKVSLAGSMMSPHLTTLKHVLILLVNHLATPSNALSLGLVQPLYLVLGRGSHLNTPSSLGKINIFDKLFGLNVGSFKTGGSTMTVNKGEYEVLKDFDQSVGASFRRIVDLSNMNNTQFVIPTGQSGSQIAPIMMIKRLFTMRGNIELPGLMKISFATINNSDT